MTRDAFQFFTGLAGAILAVMGALMLLPMPDDAAADAATEASADAAITAEGHFAVRNVRLFDGERVLERATVVVRDGVIEAVGPADETEVPEAVGLVDGTGRTLLPGLVDSHVHAYGGALTQSAVFGVTTVLDHFTDPAFVRQMRAEQDAGEAVHRADLYSAGVLVTKAGGHGTQYALEIPTFDVDAASVSADELETAAREFVQGRIDEGSDWIKIVYDRLGDPSGNDAGRRPHLSRAAVAAVIDAAHGAGRLAVVHVSEREAAREVLDDGADGLVHAWVDEPIDDALVALAQERGAFVIPTLTVLESVAGTASGAALAADDDLASYLPAAARNSLRTPFEVEPDVSRLRVALDTVAALHEAGVPILAGTDAPNPGTTYGVSMMRELELLVRAGLTPVEGLTSATSVPFAAFQLGQDLGRVVVGAPADLVLVAGDPTTDVKAMRDLLAVWKGGHLVVREPVVDEAASSSLGPGVIGTFSEESEGEGDEAPDMIPADRGFGWTATTDERMDGTSTATLRVENGALIVEGEIGDGFAYPWAGTIYFPGDRPMAPTDLSAVSELVFRARGEGAFRVMLFAPSVGQIPAQRGFDISADWAEVRIDLRELGGELKDVTALSIAAGGAPAPYRLEIDDVELR